MTIKNTANQGVPYPLANEYIKDVNDHIRNLALFVEKQLVMKFASMTDLGTKVPSPTSGMLAWVTADKTLMIYDGSAWRRIYPYAPMTYSGTAAPSSSLGAVGDFYIQY